MYTEPVGAPNRARFRLVDTYSSATEKEVQDSITKSFSCSKSSLRVLICTIAFGMGLDCVDVTQIIHWGPASDLESYMQECGRAGRNGHVKNKTISNDMTEYCFQEKRCRRSVLCDYFDSNVTDVSGFACCA